MKFLLFTILFSFPVLAIDICQFSKSTQEAVVLAIADSMDMKNQWEESNKVFQQFEKKGCSALKSYKKDQVIVFHYTGELHDYPLSKANNLFKQFPAIELITIDVKTQKIPENLFHGLPNLKEVSIGGVIERLPTRLFEQNSNLEEFIIDSDEFIGFSNSQFFRYIPGLKNLAVITPSITKELPFLELPEDFCDAVPSLVSFNRGRSVSKAPRSCQNYAWFSSLSKSF